MRENRVRQLWAEGKGAVTAWVTIASSYNAELYAAEAFDAVTIDTQHGMISVQQAIEMLKPDGERSLEANEWVVYNILDLRFVQGQRIRDIAQRMAMSESDYYRKQRVAIEQLAETLSQMERALDGRGEQDARPAQQAT